MFINCAQSYGLTCLINGKMISSMVFSRQTKDWVTKIVYGVYVKLMLKMSDSYDLTTCRDYISITIDTIVIELQSHFFIQCDIDMDLK